MKKVRLVIACSLGFLLIYSILYRIIPDRHQGRARGAGEYFHYRDFSSRLLVYVFLPAAFVEGRLIQFYPEIFLENEGWSDTPQRLVIRLPDNSEQFWIPKFNEK